MLNMFQTLIHPSSGACDFSVVSPPLSCVFVSMCVGVWRWTPTIPRFPTKMNCYSSYDYKQHSPASNNCGSNIPNYPILLLKNLLLKFHHFGDTIEKSQAPDDGCIN